MTALWGSPSVSERHDLAVAVRTGRHRAREVGGQARGAGADPLGGLADGEPGALDGPLHLDGREKLLVLPALAFERQTDDGGAVAVAEDLTRLEEGRPRRRVRETRFDDPRVVREGAALDGAETVRRILGFARAKGEEQVESVELAPLLQQVVEALEALPALCRWGPVGPRSYERDADVIRTVIPTKTPWRT